MSTATIPRARTDAAITAREALDHVTCRLAPCPLCTTTRAARDNGHWECHAAIAFRAGAWEVYDRLVTATP